MSTDQTHRLIFGAFGSLSVEDGAPGSSLRFNGKNTYLTADPMSLVSESSTVKDNAYSDTGYVKPYDWNHEADTLFACTGGNGREAPLGSWLNRKVNKLHVTASPTMP